MAATVNTVFREFETPVNGAATQELLAFCKREFKCCVFRGVYIERRYVNALNEYRDVIALHKDEKLLERMLIVLQYKLQLASMTSASGLWVGITFDKLSDEYQSLGAKDTYIWSSLNGVAYGHYFFTIRNICCREKEFTFRLQMLRSMENDIPKIGFILPPDHGGNGDANGTGCVDSSSIAMRDIQWQDFVDLFQVWGRATKNCVYDFLAKTITAPNIVDSLRALGLLTITLFCTLGCSMKILGLFTLRFVAEMNTLIRSCVPIILKLLDMISKIFGGFFILLTLIWGDLMSGGRPHRQPPSRPQRGQRRIAYF